MRAYWKRRSEWNLQRQISLRWRILGRWQSGMSTAANAQVSGVHRSTVDRWVARYRRTRTPRFTAFTVAGRFIATLLSFAF